MLIPAIAVSPRDELGVPLPVSGVVLVVELEAGTAAVVGEGRSEGWVVGDSVGASEVVGFGGVSDGNGDGDAFTGEPLLDVTLGEGDFVIASVVLGPGEPFPGGSLEQLPPGPHGSTKQQPSKPWQL